MSDTTKIVYELRKYLKCFADPSAPRMQDGLILSAAEEIERLEAELRAMKWLALGEVGTSSKTIWQVMTDLDAGGYDRPPADWDDFRRCYLLIQEFPAWRFRLDELESISAEWARLVSVWGELERMFELYYKNGRYPDHDHFEAICRSAK